MGALLISPTANAHPVQSDSLRKISGDSSINANADEAAVRLANVLQHKTEKANRKKGFFKSTSSRSTEIFSRISKNKHPLPASHKAKYSEFLVTKYDNTALRIKPLMSSDIIATLKKGSKLIVLEREVSWYKVKVHLTGKVGYIHRYMVNRF